MLLTFLALRAADDAMVCHNLPPNHYVFRSFKATFDPAVDEKCSLNLELNKLPCAFRYCTSVDSMRLAPKMAH